MKVILREARKPHKLIVEWDIKASTRLAAVQEACRLYCKLVRLPKYKLPPGTTDKQIIDHVVFDLPDPGPDDPSA